jgi:SAM-dependent methyltransferase
LADPDRAPYRVELGCGRQKRDPRSIGIDLIDFDSVDLVGDAIECLRLFPAATVDFVSGHHFIEHVSDMNGLLREVDRVLRPGGQVNFVAPHFSNPYFYSDPTHTRPVGLYTFSYLCEEETLLRRRVPRYELVLPWRIDRIELKFCAEEMFKGRNLTRRAIGKLIGASYRMMEFYEDAICWMYPAYELRFWMTKIEKP